MLCMPGFSNPSAPRVGYMSPVPQYPLYSACFAELGAEMVRINNFIMHSGIVCTVCVHMCMCVCMYVYNFVCDFVCIYMFTYV